MDPFGIVGTALDQKFQVVEPVGEGGFGVVYRGVHLALEQPIAIKCLRIPPHFGADALERFVEQFRSEGKHLAKLSQHPSIVRVYDLGVTHSAHASAIPYLVLEWLDGLDLRQAMAARRERGEGPVPEVDAVALLRPALDAIRVAHAQGIVHRDIKPANLFLANTIDGAVLKVLDFGIAKPISEGHRVSELSTQTRGGFNAFSPPYGAPEQFRPDRYGSTGPWTDVHALALVLVELLSARSPYPGDEPAELVRAATSGERPTPRRLGAQVSDELERLCAKALSLLPEDRFATGAELLRAWDGLAFAAQADPRPRAAHVDAAVPDAQSPPAADENTGAFLEGHGLELGGPEPSVSPPRTATRGGEGGPPPPLTVAAEPLAMQLAARTSQGVVGETERAVPAAALPWHRGAVPSSVPTERASSLEPGVAAAPWPATSPVQVATRPSLAARRWLLPVTMLAAALVLLALGLAYVAARSGLGNDSGGTEQSGAPSVGAGMVDALPEALALIPRPASGAWLATELDIGEDDLNVLARDPLGRSYQRRYRVARATDGRLRLDSRNAIVAREDPNACTFELRANEQDVARRIRADVLAAFPHVQIRSMHKRCVAHNGIRWTVIVETDGSPSSERSLTYGEDGQPR